MSSQQTGSALTLFPSIFVVSLHTIVIEVMQSLPMITSSTESSFLELCVPVWIFVSVYMYMYIVCVCIQETPASGVCVCVWERVKERDCKCVCVHLMYTRDTSLRCVCVCVRVCKCVCVHVYVYKRYQPQVWERELINTYTPIEVTADQKAPTNGWLRRYCRQRRTRASQGG